jgi:hypothetical protein
MAHARSSPGLGESCRGQRSRRTIANGTSAITIRAMKHQGFKCVDANSSMSPGLATGRSEDGYSPMTVLRIVQASVPMDNLPPLQVGDARMLHINDPAAL